MIPTLLSSSPLLRGRGRCIGVLTSIARRSLASAASDNNGGAFDRVGVIGLGLMGHGICQVAATSGVHDAVVAYEPKQEFLDRGRERIEKSVSKLVSKEKMTRELADEALGSIKYTTDMSDLRDVDLIVEAVIEDMNLKRDLYTGLGETCKNDTVFASNTSSLSITEMAGYSKRADKFVGIHFFNPVQIMKLVEVIRTEQTDGKVFDGVYKWVENIGKVPVSCGDTPGFIVNRLLVPNLMQAMLMVDKNIASVRDIDLSMKLGAGYPMGPLHLADYIGLDTCYYIVRGWVEKYPDEPSFFVPECLEEMVAVQKNLGRKTGRGFYHWDGDKRGDPAV